MSKRAEQAALTAYPPTYTTLKRLAKRVQSELVDTHRPVRAIFQQGYEQAEKDLALTWEDMAKIDAILLDTNNEFAVDYSKKISRQQIYEDVLKRFNEQKSPNNES